VGPKHDIDGTPGAPHASGGPDGTSAAQATGEPARDETARQSARVASAPPAPPAPSPPAADGAPADTEVAPSSEESLASDEQIEQYLEELTARAEKADEYLELAQRTKADFENYRKRAIREAAAAQDRGVAKLALELLPAVDNLDRALEAAEAASSSAPNADGAQGDGSPLISGIKLVHADVIAALARVGIEPFSPKGERFDPQHHEAIAQQPVVGAASGTVVEVYQRGYRLGDTVLRPARVIVAA